MKKNTMQRKQPMVEMNNTKYYSIDHLAALHNVSSFTIRKRIDDLKIVGVMIHRTPMYPDDPRYDRTSQTDAQRKAHRNKNTVSNYAGLFQLVKQIDDKLNLLLDHLTKDNGNGEHNGKDKT